MSDSAELTAVLTEVVSLLGQPGADARWSGYELDELLSQLREYLSRLATGSVLDERSLGELRFLFLPTGPLQETSISSGWAARFLELASRFDRAAASDVPPE
jgi:hypothetical protein